jgi:hypothetical protein
VGNALLDAHVSTSVPVTKTLFKAYRRAQRPCPSHFGEAARTLVGMLARLGFTPDEIIKCREDEGRLVAPAVVGGEPAGLVISTQRTSALTLNTQYVTQRGWRIEDRQLMRSTAVGYGPAPIGFVVVPDYTVLGVEDHFDRAVVSNEKRYVGSSVAGRLSLARLAKCYSATARWLSTSFAHQSPPRRNSALRGLSARWRSSRPIG